MMMIDFNFNGEVFDLDKTFFAEDLKKVITKYPLIKMK